jgi:hypothetical protein
VERIQRRVAEMRADGGSMEGTGQGAAVGQQTGGVGGVFGVDETVASAVPILNVGGSVVGEQSSMTAPEMGSFLGMLPDEPGMEALDMDQFWPITNWGLMQGPSW